MDTEILEAIRNLANEISRFAALQAYHAGNDYEQRDHAEALENKAELLAELVERKLESGLTQYALDASPAGWSPKPCPICGQKVCNH